MPYVRATGFAAVALLTVLLPMDRTGAQDSLNVEIVTNVPHTREVTSIVSSPDGRFVLTGSEDKTIKLWDARTARVLRTFEGHAVPVRSVAFSPDGTRIASGSADSSNKDNTVKLWDAASGRLLRTLEGHESSVRFVAFSSDGTRLLSAAHETLRVWDVENGMLLRAIKSGAIAAAAFSPDGARVAWAGHQGEKFIKLWDAASGKLLRTFKANVEWGTDSVTFSRDGAHLLSISNDGTNGTMNLWDTTTGKGIRTFKFLTATSVATLSPDGRFIASGGGVLGSGAVHLWDAATGKLVRPFEGPIDFVNSIAFSPDGSSIVAGGGPSTTMVKSWDVNTGKVLRTFEAKSRQVNSVAFSPDGTRLLSAAGNFRDTDQNTLKIWDAATGQLARSIQTQSKQVLVGAFSPDGMHAISGSRGDLKLWDLATGQLVREFIGSPGLPSWGTVYAAAFSPDGSRLASSRTSPNIDPQNRVELWEVATGKLLYFQNAHPDGVMSVKFSGDGTNLLSAGGPSWRGEINLWEAATGSLLRSTRSERLTTNAVAFSPDGSSFVSGGGTGTGIGTLLLWDTASGTERHEFKGHTDHVKSVTYSPDGTHILAGDWTGALKLWDARSGRLLRDVKGHKSTVNAVAYSPDGRRIVSGSYDTTMRVWEAASGQLLATFFGSPDAEWLVITPEGFFAASSKGTEMLSIVRGLEVFSIDQFYQELYRPDLVQEKLAGDPSGKVREAAGRLDLDKLIGSGRSPLVIFTSHKADETSATDLITVEASLADQGGGIGRAEWRVNGTTVGVVNQPDTSLQQQIVLDAGDNVVELVAYNGTNLVSSSPVRTRITWTGADPTVRPRLHVLVAGINQYLDGALKLTYAVPDAKAVAAAFQEAGKEHYEDVSVTLALDGDATAAGLDRIFRELAGKVRPRDVFVFFAAAHGKTIDGRYYMVPQDLKYQTEASLVRDGIGQDKLQAWFARILAKKAVLIFDTCEAGSLASGRVSMASAQQVTTRGLEQKTALGRLIQATGRATLTATTSTQDAYEGYGGHGVFTFAILDALARGDTNGNGLIELAELIQHVDGLVPAITEKQWGAKQFPQMDAYGSNFSLARQMASLAPSRGDDIVIPIKPTHVNTELLAIFEKAGGKGTMVQQLAPLTSITLVKSEQGWVLIAKDGKLLGYVAEAKLHKLN